MTVEVLVLGTEAFHDNWSGDPVDKIESVRQYVSNVWLGYVTDEFGNYTADVNKDTTTMVAESYIDGNTTLFDRMEDVDEWIGINTDYDSAKDSLVVLDHFGEDDDTYGVTVSGTAGCDNNITALADAYWEDPNNSDTLPAVIQSQGTEGLAAHEHLHLYQGDHEDAQVRLNDNATLMYTANKAVTYGCNSDGNTASDTVMEYSSCNVGSVRSFIVNDLGTNCDTNGGGGGDKQ